MTDTNKPTIIVCPAQTEKEIFAGLMEGVIVEQEPLPINSYEEWDKLTPALQSLYLCKKLHLPRVVNNKFVFCDYDPIALEMIERVLADRGFEVIYQRKPSGMHIYTINLGNCEYVDHVANSKAEALHHAAAKTVFRGGE